jgi:hypothetical protein
VRHQAAQAQYAVHARRFLLSDFVSIENKERLTYFPKLKVSLLALSIYTALLCAFCIRTGKETLSQVGLSWHTAEYYQPA